MAIKVVFDVPPDVKKGLADNILTRIGGVVRTQDGKIYAHLQEINNSIFNFSNGISSFNLLSIGLQAITLIYMKKKINEIQFELSNITNFLSLLDEKIDFLIKMKYLELEHDTFVGLKYLKRSKKKDPEYLEKAENHFIEGLTKLERFFESQKSIELIAKNENTALLLQCVAKNCIGEQTCLMLKGKEEKILDSLEEHKQVYRNVYEKMNQISSPLSSFPKKEELKISSYWKKTRKLKNDSYESFNFLEKQKNFQQCLLDQNNFLESLTAEEFTKSYLYLRH